MKKIFGSIAFGLLCAAWVVGCGSGNNSCNSDQVSVNNQCLQSCGNSNGQQMVQVPSMNNQCMALSQAQSIVGVNGSNGNCPPVPQYYAGSGITAVYNSIQPGMCCLVYSGGQPFTQGGQPVCSAPINNTFGGGINNCPYPHVWNGSFCQ